MTNTKLTFTRILRETAFRLAAFVPIAILGVFIIAAIAQSPTIAQTEVRLEPAGDTGENDLFGGNVAISANGGTLVVSGQGASSSTVPDSGAVFIFERVNNSWKQTARLVASNAVSTDDFGNAVAISEDGNTVAVGSEGQSGAANRSGAVYVFQRMNGGWIQQAELFSPTPANGGGFGFWGLAISGNAIAVGDAGGPGNGFTPVVDVFTDTSGIWQVSATVGVPENISFFPSSVGLSGGTLVVGSTDDGVAPGGAAYVFSLFHGLWIRRATLSPSDAISGSQFGTSVAIDGSRIAVGAPLGPGLRAFSGAAYVFAKEGNVWRQESKLTAIDGVSGDNFGFSVAVNGGLSFVGAYAHATSAGAGTGAAYLYRFKDGKSSQITELTASDAVPGGNFGVAVAIRNGTLLVGADGQHPSLESGVGYPGGEAYVYRLGN